MRRLALALAAVLSLTLGGGAAAQDEEEEPSAFQEYASGVGHTALIGLNGVLTCVADPVMATRETEPHVLGFVAGLAQMPYRAVMGALDLAFAPVPGLPMLSPEPRFKLFPWIVHDEE
jgi:hypothetical protein